MFGFSYVHAGALLVDVNSVLPFIPNKDNLGSGLLSQVVTFLLRLHFRRLLRPAYSVPLSSPRRERGRRAGLFPSVFMPQGFFDS